MKIFEIEI